MNVHDDNDDGDVADHNIILAVRPRHPTIAVMTSLDLMEA